MAGFKTKIVATSDRFKQNRADMLSLVERLRNIEQRAIDTSNKRLTVFASRNQISPNERLQRLLDPGMPFLRLHSVANYLVEDENPDTSIPGASMIVGIGFVKGVRCMVWSDDSGIKAGAMTVSTAPVSLSIQEIAMRQKLPLVHLVESAGANLVDFLVESWVGAGEVFRDLAKMSAMGLPTLSVLHGPSTAGGAYMPGMSDYVVGVKNNGLAALAGAALVKSATGEEVEERALGGTEMHASVSGLVEYLAEDDEDGIEIARNVVDQLDWNRNTAQQSRRDFEAPKHSPDELAGVVPTEYKTPYDMREILLRICDGSDFNEFKPDFGVTTVCSHASIMGVRCGIIGNNGPIDPQGANKSGQFIQLCDQSNTPLVFLSNTTGFIVGTESEQAGMIKHGAKMIQAVTNALVPKITLYIGASFGAGNYAMCGWPYKPDFLFSWPNARTNVMGGEQAAGTMRTVMEASSVKRGLPIDEVKMNQQSATIEAHFTKQESAFYCSGRVLDHGVIDPRDTRNVLGFVLETCVEARNRTLRANSFGIARL